LIARFSAAITFGLSSVKSLGLISSRWRAVVILVLQLATFFFSQSAFGHDCDVIELHLNVGEACLWITADRIETTSS